MGREGATHLTTSKSAIYRDFSRLIGEKCVAPEDKRPYLELLRTHQMSCLYGDSVIA